MGRKRASFLENRRGGGVDWVGLLSYNGVVRAVEPARIYVDSANSADLREGGVSEGSPRCNVFPRRALLLIGKTIHGGGGSNA